ncbi:transmembrane anterior posterior transformation protein 1-like isoform X2 [Anneissia japonica]|uniref:transmembrane anterior posterior transformation protein 1-like isoform X2 n=1 Tax=Anneissia japonica TaxID=1529436 RepID=UPI0014255BE0|nr:transmembrane anterior posterior transformation protein 1-like isoform X2 [Anneissia japonica]
MVISFLNGDVDEGSSRIENDRLKYDQRTRNLISFFKVPWQLEKMGFYALLLSMDIFLFVFTILPIRVVIAVLKLIIIGPYRLVRGGRVLEPVQVCYLLKGVVVVASYWLLCYVDISMLYHFIRKRAKISLFILYGMLEVADRLFTLLGQDTLDVLFWTAVHPDKKKRALPAVFIHTVIAIFAMFGHAVVVILEATTLNVSFNSPNTSRAFFSILRASKVTELKGNAFKKLKKENLFEVACADIRERNIFVVILPMIVLLNMTEVSWDLDLFSKWFPSACIVVLVEILIDWVKHAFIVKCNNLQPEIYMEYRAKLAYQMFSVHSRKTTAYSDYNESISRTMTLIPIPLCILTIRVARQSFSYIGVHTVAVLILMFICLTLLKILLSIFLMGRGCKYIADFKLHESSQKKYK